MLNLFQKNRHCIGCGNLQQYLRLFPGQAQPSSSRTIDFLAQNMWNRRIDMVALQDTRIDKDREFSLEEIGNTAFNIEYLVLYHISTFQLLGNPNMERAPIIRLTKMDRDTRGDPSTN